MVVFRSEVEEWLHSIGLVHLYPLFIEDGFTTLESVRRMRQADIDSIVDRNGLMLVLNDEIDRLNYDTVAQASASQYYEEAPLSYETRESLISRYESRGVPAVGYASRLLERRSKSMSKKNRATSLAPLVVRSSSVIRYVPNSASDAYEALFAHKRAASLAAASHREAQHAAAAAALDESRRRKEEDRIRRARSGNYF